jgi:hypothetical protein
METGKLTDVLRTDNYKLVVPFAGSLEAALDFFCMLYGNTDGIFTAYHVRLVG